MQIDRNVHDREPNEAGVPPTTQTDDAPEPPRRIPRSTPNLRQACVRAAFKCQRSAQRSRCRWLFYVEHNMFEDARRARESTLQQLRMACKQWRLALGDP